MSDCDDRSFVRTVLRTAGQQKRLHESLRFVRVTNQVNSSVPWPDAQPKQPRKLSGLASSSSGCHACLCYDLYMNLYSVDIGGVSLFRSRFGFSWCDGEQEQRLI